MNLRFGLKLKQKLDILFIDNVNVATCGILNTNSHHKKGGFIDPKQNMQEHQLKNTPGTRRRASPVRSCALCFY